MHLVRIHKLVEQIKPQAVILDPITNLMLSGTEREIQAMLTRLIDFLKARGTTALLTSLTSGSNMENAERSEVGISSLIDTWILLRDLEVDGERNRGLYVVKSRGMAHSNRVREFMLTRRGIKLIPVYLGAGGVLTGSARVAQEAREKAQAVARQQESEKRVFDLERKRKAMEAQIEALRAEFAAEAGETEREIEQDRLRESQFLDDRATMARSRKTNSLAGGPEMNRRQN
jgi:circadian clock protein KaiC